jgi:uncharacterized protein (TIRG00374 family)
MKLFFRAVITAILFGIVIWKMGGLTKVGGIFSQLKIPYLILILIVLTADRGLMTYKWLRLLRLKGIYVGLIQGMKLYCASMIWGMFLPATLGADVIRIVSIVRKGYDSKEIVASVIIERMVGFLAALLLGSMSCVLVMQYTDMKPQLEYVFWIGFAVLALCLFLFIISLDDRLFEILHKKIFIKYKEMWIVQKFRRFHSSYIGYRKNKREIIIFSGLTLFEQLMPILVSWLIAKALAVEINLAIIAGAFPLALLISRLPISINGLGLFEAVFSFLMSMGGVAVAEAFAIAFSGRILQIISWLPWWASEVIGSRNLKAPTTISAKC